MFLRIASITMFCLLSTRSFADQIDNFWAFVDHYKRVEHVQVECEYTRSMTLEPSPGVALHAVARGDYQYIRTPEGFKVIVDIVADDEQSSMLEQRGVYSFDGSTYRVFNHKLDTSEDRASEPNASVEFPLNPMLFPVAMLRSDLDAAQLLDIRHFDSRRSIQNMVESTLLKVDDESNQYIELKIKPEHNQEYSEGVESHFRVYMDRFVEVNSNGSLPRRVELVQDGVEIVVIQILSYANFETPDGEVYLPNESSFVVIEGDEATIEFRVEDLEYSLPEDRDDLFLINQDAGTHITDNAIVNNDGSSAQLPDDAHDRRAMAPKKMNPPKSILGGIAISMIGLVIVAILVLVVIRERT